MGPNNNKQDTPPNGATELLNTILKVLNNTTIKTMPILQIIHNVYVDISRDILSRNYNKLRIKLDELYVLWDFLWADMDSDWLILCVLKDMEVVIIELDNVCSGL